MRISDWSSDVCSSDLALGDRCINTQFDQPVTVRIHALQAERIATAQILDCAIAADAALEAVLNLRIGTIGDTVGITEQSPGLHAQNRREDGLGGMIPLQPDASATRTEESRLGNGCVIRVDHG